MKQAQTHEPSSALAMPHWKAYFIALASVIITTGLAFMLHRVLPLASLSLLFLTGILIVSARMGLRAGLAASILSFLAYNFFFTTPLHTFAVHDDGDVATLLFFLIMATISGNLAARMHREMRQRQDSLHRISKMFEFGRRMSSAAQTGQVLTALVDELAEELNSPVAVLVPGDDGQWREAARTSSAAVPLESVQEAWDRASDEPLALDGRLFLKLGAGPVAMVVVDRAPGQQEAQDLARSFCDQAAIALDRTLLASDLDEARVATEREQLRTALLSSLSHDLRTPLASVIGSTSSVLECGAAISEDDRNELLRNTLEEARRLDRYIQNLLDMTRIGQGGLSLERNWVELHDIVSGATARLDLVPGQFPLTVDIPRDFPLLWVHGALLEQALVNLLDNATRYSPRDGQIGITARQQGDQAIIEVTDQGPGIPPGEREKVFDMFYTASDSGDSLGTGLGLAICRGMVAAHAGSVAAGEGPGGKGTRMRITLPLAQHSGPVPER